MSETVVEEKLERCQADLYHLSTEVLACQNQRRENISKIKSRDRRFRGKWRNLQVWLQTLLQNATMQDGSSQYLKLGERIDRTDSTEMPQCYFHVRFQYQ